MTHLSHMPLNLEHRRALFEGITGSFTPGELETLLYLRLGKLPHLIAGGRAAFPELVTQLLIDAQLKEWEDELAVAAAEARPRNGKLRTVADAILSSPFQSADVELERRLKPYDVSFDVLPWRTEMAEQEARVCRIEMTAAGIRATGTGFLVGPDLVMTNYHVAFPYFSTAQVSFRFDYKRLATGGIANGGVVYGLADEWRVISSPFSPIDTQREPRNDAPSDDQLDFAVVRLNGDAGKHAIGMSQPACGDPPRGWIALSPSVAVVPQQPMVILQHPDGRPLQASIDRALGYNANATRLKHSVPTEPGSSGSPCFDLQWRLVGLHRGGDPNFDSDHQPEFNEAIPSAAIARALERAGVSLPPLSST